MCCYQHGRNACTPPEDGLDSGYSRVRKRTPVLRVWKEVYRGPRGRCVSTPPTLFRVSGSGFRVPGVGFRVSGSGFWVPGFGFRISGFGFWTSMRAEATPSRRCFVETWLTVSSLGFGVWGLGFEVWGVVFEDWGLGSWF